MTETHNPAATFILPLTSQQAKLQNVGGKGANLCRLACAGFRVPPAFLVTVSAYQYFISANRLEEDIASFSNNARLDDPQNLEYCSAEIRRRFTAGSIPKAVADDLRHAYLSLGQTAVAVRSSATAEDLPDLSFAGQQDTFLNVVGEEQLLKALVDCWSSLWTARAIGYRLRNRIEHAGVQIAVVVQAMVESQASGVLFTANPLSGLRGECVIDATCGLGEALVSGRVEPDHYVVSAAEKRILSRSLGSKQLSIHGAPGGGTQEQIEERAAVQALSDENILALAELGCQVEALYAFPQDIEWAWSDETLYLLQSRPITSLYPLPAGMPPEPLKVMFSFAAVQGIMEPITPIGQDALRWVAATIARLFGVRIPRHTQTVFFVAGERLWANITALFRNTVGRRMLPSIFDLVEPTVRQALQQIWDDPHLQPARKGISIHARMQLVHFGIPLAGNMLLNLLAPRKRRKFIVASGERILQQVEQRSSQVSGDPHEKLAQRIGLFSDLVTKNVHRIFPLFVSGVAAGMASWNLLNMLTQKMITPTGNGKGRLHDLVMEITRGMPYNPTTEMDLALWDIAKGIQGDASLLAVFRQHESAELAAAYQLRGLPPALLQAVDAFLARYGGRGVGEIDLGRSRWAEDPAHVFEMLSSFLQITNEAQAPDVVFRRSAESARQTVEQLVNIAAGSPHGWLKARLVRFLSGRVRNLLGLRENPKFFVVRLMWIIRRELLKSGQEFAASGELEQPDDVCFLTFDELASLASGAQVNWRSLVAQRRAVYQREILRRQIPRLLLSDGRAFYEGMNMQGDDQHVIHGSPVSPGSVEGQVRVVLDPRQAGLLPGEIMVCPGTDPSWTPLFLSAVGLVMETGGMMTHGAVVAREYGIPAIVGVDRATLRLHTGQRIRMDGSSGQIVLLGETEA